MATRRDVQEFRWHYRELVVKGDLPAFEALLAEHAPHLSEADKREYVEEFKRAAARALRFRWRSSR